MFLGFLKKKNSEITVLIGDLKCFIIRVYGAFKKFIFVHKIADPG